MKLHELVAIRKGIKTRTYAALSQLHKISQKAELYNGMTKEYHPIEEDGLKLPPASTIVQSFFEDILNQARTIATEAWDTEATQEWGNQQATATLTLGNLTIENVPATFLLYMEKQLSDLYTFVEKLPTLDSDKIWLKDENSRTYVTDEVKTARTETVTSPVVVTEATDKHPAQWTNVNKIMTRGYWHTRNQSGAMPKPLKAKLLTRITTARDEVKRARSRANDTEVEKKQVASALFDYLFHDM